MQRWFFVENEDNEKLRALGDVGEETLDLSLKASNIIDYSERKSWLFKVQIDNLRPGEILCVTGNCDVLGNWAIDKCVHLSHDINANIWLKVISLPCHVNIEYRYAVCNIVEPYQNVIVRRWETHLQPRRITTETVCPTPKSVPEEFGYYDNMVHIERGWLSKDTVIQFKLFNNPIVIWRQRLIGRKLYLKMTPVSLVHHQPESLVEAFEESLSMDTQEFVEPPAYTVTEVASLSSEDNTFQLQGQFGMPYNDDDYLIFQASVLQPQNVAYLIDFYVYSSHATDTDPPYHVGFSYVLPGTLKNSEGHMIVPITSIKQRPLGQLSLEYLVINPLKDTICDLQISYARHWKQSWAGLDVAHRGLGSNFVDTQRCAEVRENTIASFKTAASHGADFVEFDVQLSKDLVPVIYHDFHVCISMKRKKELQDTDMLQLPVKELTLEQLRLLKVYHLEEGKDKNPRFFDEHLEEHQPFPTLQQLLEVIDDHVGFNIEIKWTMKLKDGSFELLHPFDLNLYLDEILNVVLKYAGQRRIIFSCFNPDICTMVRLKQNKYPVMFLTQGETARYPSYHDARCLNVKAAVQHAVTMELLGIIVHTEDILRDASLVNLALDAGLVIFCWGNDNNDTSTIKHLKKIGLHGVIFDKIDEFSSKEVKESIFLIEARESQRKELMALAAAQIEAAASTPSQVPSASVFTYANSLDVERARQQFPIVQSTATSLESLESLENENLNEKNICDKSSLKNNITFSGSKNDDQLNQILSNKSRGDFFKQPIDAPSVVRND